MMTKVNKSFHETIIIILSVRLGSDESMSPGCLGKYIILSMYWGPFAPEVI
jgi:hypothetical protein